MLRAQQACTRRLQVTQTFLLRTIRKRDLDLIGSPAVLQMDTRLQSLSRALATSLELQHWKFDDKVKAAIASSAASFAELCQAAEPLTVLVRLQHFMHRRAWHTLALVCRKAACTQTHST